MAATFNFQFSTYHKYNSIRENTCDARSHFHFSIFNFHFSIFFPSLQLATVILKITDNRYSLPPQKVVLLQMKIRGKKSFVI